MTVLDEKFAQLSPLADDIVSRIDSFGLPAIDVVNLSTQAILRIAVGTRISLAQAANGGRVLTPKERGELMLLLMDGTALQ